MYIYNTIILKDPMSFKKTDGGNQLSAADITAHQDAKTDFETSFKSTAQKIDQIILAETTICIDKTYSNFKALIDGITITWADVKYIEESSFSYKLFLLTGNLL